MFLGVKTSTVYRGVLCFRIQTMLQSHCTLAYLQKASARAAAAKPKVKGYSNASISWPCRQLQCALRKNVENEKCR